MGRLLGILSLLVLLLAVATPSLARDRPRHRPERLRERMAERNPAESARDTAIRRARSEIQRNPSQKKFILFRYGLSENDLR
jgi:hypothetical protein